MIIEATQYHFPHGRKERITGEVSDDLKPQWTALMAAGLALEMEVLPNTSLVHITLTDDERGDYQMRVTPNTMELLHVVEDMIRAFDPEDLGAWRVSWDAEAAEATAEARNDDFMLSIDGDNDDAEG